MEKNVFGRNLKFYRQQMKITQSKLAEKAGIGQVSIANYERGTRFPGEETLIKLATSLGLPLDLLFNNYKSNSEATTEISFDLDHLIEMLLSDSLENCQSYLNGWKKVKNYSLYLFFSEILIPLLKETGNRWFNGDISIAEEHIISNRIREMISLFSSSEDVKEIQNNSNIWMGFCAPSDKHDLVLFMLSKLLKISGWKTIFLGTDVPLNDLIDVMARYKPSVISISLSMPLFESGLDAYLQKIELISGGHCPIIIGGNSESDSPGSQYGNKISYVSSLKEGYESVLLYQK